MRTTFIPKIALCVLAIFELHAAQNSSSFTVFRADGKFVIADQQTYTRMTQQSTTPSLTTIKKSAGTTLPGLADMQSVIASIQAMNSPTVTFMSQGSQVAQLTIARDKNSYTMKTSSRYDPKKAPSYFGVYLSMLIPDVDALYATLTPGATLTRSLTPPPAPTTSDTEQTQPTPPTSSSAQAQQQQPVVSTKETKTRVAPQTTLASKPTSSSTASPVQSAADTTAQAPATATNPFDLSASSAPEYYLFLSLGKVYLTYDKKVAQGLGDITDANALLITYMTDADTRLFAEKNIAAAKNYFSAVKKDMQLLIYKQKNVIAKASFKNGAFANSIIYFDKNNRETLINDYGTALRYLTGLNGNTQKYESVLVRGRSS